jgi:hypothetical protein
MPTLLLIVSAFVYFLGYRADSERMSATGPSYFKKKISPPKFVFLICACPKSEKVPLGVMVVGGVVNQLLGIGWAICALIFFVYPKLGSTGMGQVAIQAVSLSLVLAGAYLIPYWLSKKYPFN